MVISVPTAWLTSGTVTGVRSTMCQVRDSDGLVINPRSKVPPRVMYSTSRPAQHVPTSMTTLLPSCLSYTMASDEPHLMPLGNGNADRGIVTGHIRQPSASPCVR
jgi:hypothetical protein